MSDAAVQPLGVEAATELLADRWAIEGELSPLPGYEDENYRVRSSQGQFVFRISHPGVVRASLETQNAAMRSIADGTEWKMPATIDDPAILDEITEEMRERGMIKGG